MEGFAMKSLREPVNLTWRLPIGSIGEPTSVSEAAVNQRTQRCVVCSFANAHWLRSQWPPFYFRHLVADLSGPLGRSG